VSVVGTAEALHAGVEGWTAALERSGVVLRGCELADRRCTFVVPESQRTHAASTVYEAIWQKT
jgi:hypothetical protein